MKVLSVHELTLPDNDNRAPNVIPIPRRTFEGVMSAAGAVELMRMMEEVPVTTVR